MKKGLALFALAVLLLPAAVFADSCSCNAPDGSCSASTSCPGGCYAVCANGGGCASGCSGGGGSGNWHPRTNNLSGASADPDRLLNLSAQSLTAGDVSAMLSQYLGEAVEFVPLDPAELYSIDVSRMPSGEFLTALSEFGAIATPGKEPPRESGASRGIPESEVSIKLERTTAGQVAAILGQFITSPGWLLEAGDPQEELSLEVQHMSLEDLLRGLDATSSIRLVRVEP
jgi:hypothetical protein